MSGTAVDEQAPPPRIGRVPTSVTAFLGVTGGSATASLIEGMRDFAVLWPAGSALATAVDEFFRHGGSSAWVSPLPEMTADAVRAATAGLHPDVALVAVPGDTAASPALIGAAAEALSGRSAMLLVEGPWADADAAVASLASGSALGADGPGVAVYWPRLRRGGATVSPLGPVAGVMARTDAARGVFRAPAGSDAVLDGLEPTVAVASADADRLNRLGVNVIRSFAGRGTLVWGARTRSTDAEWRFVPVRRTALLLRESIGRGLGWAVFEPNTDALWIRVRASVGDFLHELFRAGAFAGRTPRDSYFVKCDRTTMSDADIDNGELVVQVGFSPLKPAEFAVLTLRVRAKPAP